MAEKLVLAYSDGLDTSVMVHWIKEEFLQDYVFPAIKEIWAMPTVAANARKRELLGKPIPYNVAEKATAQTRKTK